MVGERSIRIYTEKANVGHLLFTEPETGAIFITEIDVAEPWRRRGLGTALLDALVAAYPATFIMVSDRETNSAEGNALLEAYLRRHPGAFDFAGG